MKRWISSSLQMTLECGCVGGVTGMGFLAFQDVIPSSPRAKYQEATCSTLKCQPLPTLHQLHKPHWLTIPWDRTWIWQLVKAAFSDFCLPGCDISQRNEVEKSSSFQSSGLFIPTAVLMARQKVASELEALLADDIAYEE